LIVHDGIVDRFNRSLDEYPAWLKEQQLSEGLPDVAEADTSSSGKQPSKKQLRQQEAQRRQRLKPMLDKVREIEKQLTANRTSLDSLDKRLTDEAIYKDPERKSELTELIKEQTTIKSTIDTLEWDWMEASEKLENAE
jgi:ATP-binding cassette subfamily F protein 3